MLVQRRKTQDSAVKSYSIDRIKLDTVVILSFALLMIICMYPELSLAATMEDQLDKTNTLVAGKGKTIGITIATVFATVVAMAKGNPKVAGTVVGIGVVMALFLEWVASGMKLVA